MQFTGERVIPEMQTHDPRDVQAHMARYVWAMHPYCFGKRVLDAACGVGYGTAILSVGAASVVGVDIDQETIEYAREKYAGPRIAFVQWNVEGLQDLPFLPEVVVSFETIEHLQHPELFLSWVSKSFWSHGGILICSAPENSGSRFHVRDYTREELDALLRPHFMRRKYFSQDIGMECLIREIVAHSDHPTHIFVCEGATGE